MTSATDNRTTELLRKMLDERGVEYDETSDYVTTAYTDDKVIRYYGYNGDFSVEVLFPRARLNDTEWLTPEQAVAATLGAGECEPIIEPWACAPNKYDAYCGNCKYPLGDGKIKPWNFCPNCGARIRKAVER